MSSERSYPLPHGQSGGADWGNGESTAEPFVAYVTCGQSRAHLWVRTSSRDHTPEGTLRLDESPARLARIRSFKPLSCFASLLRDVSSGRICPVVFQRHLQCTRQHSPVKHKKRGPISWGLFLFQTQDVVPGRYAYFPSSTEQLTPRAFAMLASLVAGMSAVPWR